MTGRIREEVQEVKGRILRPKDEELEEQEEQEEVGEEAQVAALQEAQGLLLRELCRLRGEGKEGAGGHGDTCKEVNII